MTKNELLARWELLYEWALNSSDRVPLVIDNLERAALPERYDPDDGASWDDIHHELVRDNAELIVKTGNMLRDFVHSPLDQTWIGPQLYLEAEGYPPVPDDTQERFLPMKWDWLLVWFAFKLVDQGMMVGRLLENESPDSTGGGGCYTRAESTDCVRNLACLVTHALQAMENGAPEPVPPQVGALEFSRSLFYLVSELGHLDLGLPRQLRIEWHLRKMLQTETGLYMTQGFYRDHTFHVIFVFLLGWFLLECRSPTGKGTLFIDRLRALFDKGAPRPKGKRPPKRETVKRNWFFTSLFHDLGYPISLFWDVSKLVEFLGSEEIDALREGISSAGDQGFRKFRDSARDKFSLGCSLGETLDHGLGSALHAQHFLKNVVRDADLEEELAPAIDAIARHNLTDSRFRVGNPRGASKLPNEPLTFLLILCDEIQEFGRRRVDVERYREEIAAKTQFTADEPLAGTRSLDYLLLSVVPKENKKGFAFSPGALEVQLLYRRLTRPEESYLGVWLKRTRNLQRVVVPGKDILHILVRALWPQSQERFQSLDGSDDVEILAHYARNGHHWDLDEWIQEACSRKKRVKYTPANTDGAGHFSNSYGEFCVDLNALSKKQLLPREPDLPEIYKWFQTYTARARYHLPP